MGLPLIWARCATTIDVTERMIKIYGMKSCPDCAFVEAQVKGNDRYEVIDIGEHIRSLKEFLRLRDSSSVFSEARQKGYVGVPCFVLEDGSITLDPEVAGLESKAAGGASCRLDGSGC